MRLLIYGQRKNFFESKKVLLIPENFLWSKEIDLFTLKNNFLNEKNIVQFKETVFWVQYFSQFLIPKLNFLRLEANFPR